MRALTLALLLVSAPAAAVADEQRFAFPGDEMSAPSPTGRLMARYSRISDEEPMRFVVAEKDSEIAGFDFLRTVDGVWQDGSDGLFVNNHIGSNASDCLVLTEADGKHAFTSLRGLLDQDGSIGKESAWIKPAQLAPDAEYHLVCERWDGGDAIDLSITGNTGVEAFKYALQVNLATGSFKFTK